MASARPRKSTIVRAKFRLLRGTFGVLERVAPETGADLALKLWCTPRHARPSDGGVVPGLHHLVPVHGGTVHVEV